MSNLQLKIVRPSVCIKKNPDTQKTIMCANTIDNRKCWPIRYYRRLMIHSSEISHNGSVNIYVSFVAQAQLSTKNLPFCEERCRTTKLTKNHDKTIRKHPSTSRRKDCRIHNWRNHAIQRKPIRINMNCESYHNIYAVLNFAYMITTLRISSSVWSKL
jgi:hypothetical protein